MSTAQNADTVTAALDYLRRGFSIFPLRPHAKEPAIKWAKFQSRHPTEDEVRTWWGEHPDWGVAIVTGKISDIVVVDVDPRNGGDNEATACDCPSNLVAQTGGGGLHIFCRHPGGKVSSGKTSRPGVDRKGDGGYVCAAPSIHPSGKPYVWLSEGEPGELPAWALNKGEEGAGEAVGVDEPLDPREPWIAEALGHPERVLPGTQEQMLTKLAYYLAGKHPEDIAFGILMPWVQRLPLGRPELWTEDHVRVRLESAYRKHALEPGAAGPLVNDTQARGSGAPGRELRFVSYDELAEQVREMSKRPWLVPGWLRARGLFLIAGPSHFGKTWVSIDLAVSIAVGGKFLNAYPVDPGEDGGRRVLYIVGEDDAPDFMERLDSVLAAKDAQPRVCFEGEDEDAVARCHGARARHDAFRRNFRVHCERQFLFGNQEAHAQLLEVVRDFKPSLIIFDPLKDMVLGEDVEGFFSKAVEYTHFLRDLRDVADCCVGIVHHTTKGLDWDKPDAGISGRSEFIASFEHRFICYPVPVCTEGEDDDGVSLRWSRGAIQRRMKSSAPHDPVLIRYAGLTEELVLVAQEVTAEEGKARVDGRSRSEELEPQILDVIEEAALISGHAIHERLRALGVRVAWKTVLESLHQLRAAGRIREDKKGYAPAQSPGPLVENPYAQQGTSTGTKSPTHGEELVVPGSLYEPGDLRDQGPRTPLVVERAHRRRSDGETREVRKRETTSQRRRRSRNAHRVGRSTVRNRVSTASARARVTKHGRAGRRTS